MSKVRFYFVATLISLFGVSVLETMFRKTLNFGYAYAVMGVTLIGLIFFVAMLCAMLAPHKPEDSE